MSQTEKRKPKLVRGWSLSPENQMALNAEAKDLTLERTDGKTTSGSSVLDCCSLHADMVIAIATMADSRTKMFMA